MSMSSHLPTITLTDEPGVHVLLGGMYSNKTGHLMNLIALYQRKNRKRVICVTSILDKDRTGTCSTIQTHNGVHASAISCRKLADIMNQLDLYDIILIDEGHLIEDIVLASTELVDKKGKIVYVAALNGDSDMKPWDSISKLIPYADSITFCYSICDVCGKSNGIYSHCLEEKSTKVKIGGSGLYAALCRKCSNIPDLNKSHFE
jgi:thymidine kinase